MVSGDQHFPRAEAQRAEARFLLTLYSQRISQAQCECSRHWLQEHSRKGPINSKAARLYLTSITTNITAEGAVQRNSDHFENFCQLMRSWGKDSEETAFLKQNGDLCALY